MLRNNADARRCSYFELGPLVISPGHNQIWICNFLQSDWLRAQPKHWIDRERTKLDRNVEQGNLEANSCRVLWVECTLKKSNCNTEPIYRDYFMRHSVRFTNIEMLMIENAFCKHPWISDNLSRDQKQLDDSDQIWRIGNLNTAIHCEWKGFKKSCLEKFLQAQLRPGEVCSILLRGQYHTR